MCCAMRTTGLRSYEVERPRATRRRRGRVLRAPCVENSPSRPELRLTTRKSGPARCARDWFAGAANPRLRGRACRAKRASARRVGRAARVRIRAAGSTRRGMTASSCATAASPRVRDHSIRMPDSDLWNANVVAAIEKGNRTPTTRRMRRRVGRSRARRSRGRGATAPIAQRRQPRDDLIVLRWNCERGSFPLCRFRCYPEW